MIRDIEILLMIWLLSFLPSKFAPLATNYVQKILRVLRLRLRLRLGS